MLKSTVSVSLVYTDTTDDEEFIQLMKSEGIEDKLKDALIKMIKNNLSEKGTVDINELKLVMEELE